MEERISGPSSGELPASELEDELRIDVRTVQVRQIGRGPSPRTDLRHRQRPAIVLRLRLKKCRATRRVLRPDRAHEKRTILPMKQRSHVVAITDDSVDWLGKREA